MLLNETCLSNQHVEFIRMFFITGLTALSYFTHCVSLPLLGFVNAQDLKNGKMDTVLLLSCVWACTHQTSNIRNRSPSSEGHVWGSIKIYTATMWMQVWIWPRNWSTCPFYTAAFVEKRIWLASQQIIYQVNVCFWQKGNSSKVPK